MKPVDLICVCVILASGLALAQSNPVPLVNQPLVPMTVAPGGPSFTLTLNGTGFVSGAVVSWNGTALATQFVSGSRLTATVPAANIAVPQTASIMVTNPPQGGGISNSQFLTVSAPTTLHFTNVPLPGTSGASGKAVALDLNRDGKLDLAFITFQPTNEYTIHVLLGNGDGTFQPDIVTPQGLQTLHVGDFNGDGKLDFAGVYDASLFGFWYVLLGNGDGTFSNAGLEPEIPYPVADLVAGDFNGDGRLDVAISDAHHSLLVFLGNGDGTFQNSLAPITAPQFLGGAVGDFNGDGKLDLIGVKVGTGGNQLGWLQGNGDGTFQNPSAFYAVDSSTESVTAADVNGDGKLDVIAGQPFGSVFTLFLGNGDGTFQAGVPSTYGGVNLLGDFNADGKLDLAVVNATGSFILLGNGDGTFQTPVALPHLLIAAGDFNNDGKMDFVGISPPDGGLVLLLQDVSPAGLAPSSLFFDRRQVGTVSSPQNVTLTNLGTGTLTLSNITVLGPNAGDFPQTNNCPANLSVGASCMIGVSFAPTVVGTSETASLTVTDNASGSPQTVALSGTGLGFAVAPSGAATATIAAGQTASYPIAVNSGGGFNQAVTLTCSGAPTGATCSVSPNSVTPSGSSPAMATVTVATKAASASLIELLGGRSSGILSCLAMTGTLGMPMLISLAGRRRQRRSRILVALGIVCLLSIGLTMSACGGGSNSGGNGGGSGGVQPGTYSLTVTASSKSGSTTLTSTAKLTLVVQ